MSNINLNIPVGVTSARLSNFSFTGVDGVGLSAPPPALVVSGTGVVKTAVFDVASNALDFTLAPKAKIGDAGTLVLEMLGALVEIAVVMVGPSLAEIIIDARSLVYDRAA